MTRTGRITLALLVLSGAGLVAAWDWNWFREPVVRHFAERSGRDVQVGDLSVRFDHGLNPTVRLRDVAIANAPWARATAGETFATAGEVAFTFDWRSLFDRDPIVVTHLVLVDARIALERRADGLRNWRLRDPDNRGPGRFRFQRLEAHQTRLHFAHEGAGIDVRTSATDLPAARGPLATRILFEGTYRGAAFDGQADTSRVLSFLDTGDTFAIDGHGRSGRTRLDAEGQVADLFQLGSVDAQLKLAGPSLADVRRLLPQAWPATAAYTAKAHLVKTQSQWHFTEVRADIGRSDIGGELRYQEDADRPYLEATLSSQATHVGDLLPDAPATTGKSPPDQDGPPSLHRFDGEVSLLVRSLHAPHVPPLTQLRVKAKLDDGLLALSPVQWQMAGGQVQGLANYDTRVQPSAVRAELTWRNLRLEQLLPKLPADGEATGPVSGDARLTSQGDTLQALLRHADGKATASLKGGRLSAGLDARLALDGGKLLRSAVTDAADVPIVCARADVVLKDGHGEVFPLLLETASTRVDGRGTLDLHQRHVEALLTPTPKGTGLLALRKSVKVATGKDGLDVSLVKAEAITPEAPCDPPAVKSR